MKTFRDLKPNSYFRFHNEEALHNRNEFLPDCNEYTNNQKVIEYELTEVKEPVVTYKDIALGTKFRWKISCDDSIKLKLMDKDSQLGFAHIKPEHVHFGKFFLIEAFSLYDYEVEVLG